MSVACTAAFSSFRLIALMVRRMASAVEAVPKFADSDPSRLLIVEVVPIP